MSILEISVSEGVIKLPPPVNVANTQWVKDAVTAIVWATSSLQPLLQTLRYCFQNDQEFLSYLYDTNGQIAIAEQRISETLASSYDLEIFLGRYFSDNLTPQAIENILTDFQANPEINRMIINTFFPFAQYSKGDAWVVTTFWQIADCQAYLAIKFPEQVVKAIASQRRSICLETLRVIKESNSPIYHQLINAIAQSPTIGNFSLYGSEGDKAPEYKQIWDDVLKLRNN